MPAQATILSKTLNYLNGEDKKEGRKRGREGGTEKERERERETCVVGVKEMALPHYSYKACLILQS